MAPDQPLQVSALLEKLDAHDVEYVIIGGIAVGLHGHARATKDLDIMIEPSPANVERLWAFIEDVDAEPLALDDFSADELPLPFEPASILKGGNWLLHTRLGRVDVMQFAEGAPPYTELAERSLLGDLDGLAAPIRVCGLDDLLAMKRAADRAIDRGDVERLEQIHQPDVG